MKIRLASILVFSAICSSFAEPGGTYTLTGKEKGLAEIIKADMAQFPDLYTGESLNSYISKFKKENKIGKRKLSPGDELLFPETIASRKLKSSLKIVSAPSSEARINTHAKITCPYKLGRFKDHSTSCKNADETFINVPDKYNEARVPLCPKNSPDPLVFKVIEPGIVTLVTDKRHKSALEDKGWSAVAQAGRMNPGGDIYKLKIYEKHLDVGEYSYTKTELQEPFGIRVLIF